MQSAHTQIPSRGIASFHVVQAQAQTQAPVHRRQCKCMPGIGAPVNALPHETKGPGWYSANLPVWSLPLGTVVKLRPPCGLPFSYLSAIDRLPSPFPRAQTRA